MVIPLMAVNVLHVIAITEPTTATENLANVIAQQRVLLGTSVKNAMRQTITIPIQAVTNLVIVSNYDNLVYQLTILCLILKSSFQTMTISTPY